jgi:Fanconi anemia group M protein
MAEVKSKIFEPVENSILNDKLESREYQIEIAKKCINKNSLVVLPTGLGKTIIAVLVAAMTLKYFPDESKVIMLAPTKPLINQHYFSFAKFLNIPKEKYSILTGKIPPEKRGQKFIESQILFYTSQTLRNDIVNRRYTLENVCLIIFDEAHHASGDYPYNLIADKYKDQNPDFNILALTASPGASKSKIAGLCKNLHIPPNNIHSRTRKDEDVKRYIKTMNLYKIGVDLTSLMEDIYLALQFSLEQRLQYLSQYSFLDIKSEKLTKKVIRKDLVRLNNELIKIINGDGDKTGAYTAISINAQALILYHMLELLEQQGLDILLKYMERLNKNAKKKNSSKAVKILATDPGLRKIFIDLKKNQEYSPENLVHPKYNVLRKILTDELYYNPNSRILVFVKLRDSVKNIVDKLKQFNGIRAIRFVGQANKSSDDKGLSQKRQIEILEQFKTGKYNVLVSTNVGEEGLDITECDLVVFYDVVVSEIRLIQRKGRTARHREGKVIILYCKDTNDEKYLNIALNKLKSMKINLKNPEELKEYYNQVLLNDNLDKENNQNNSKVELKKKINIKQHTLQSFFNVRKTERNISKIDNSKQIIISNSIPGKYGLRKLFEKEEMNYEISSSKNHIQISNKVLIQIKNNPKNYQEQNLVKLSQEYRKIFILTMFIFDFSDFIEKFEGEKRLLKYEINTYAEKENLQITNIDIAEELHFIIKEFYYKKEGN